MSNRQKSKFLLTVLYILFMATNLQQVMRDRKVLINRGIEQAWHRRLLNHIHAGVRVKIRHIPMQKMNDIAIQTVPIQYVHRHTSYEFIDSSSSPSESPDADSSTSEITSPSTDTSSMHKAYSRYPNRNNHALDTNQISEEQKRQRRLFTPFLQPFSLFRFQTWTSKSRCRRSINRDRPTPTLPIESSSSTIAQVLQVTNNASLRVKTRHILSDLSRLIASDHQNSNNHLAWPQEHSQLQEKTNPIIENGIALLHRYQQYAQGYQLKSDPAVKKFLFESVALSAEALH